MCVRNSAFLIFCLLLFLGLVEAQTKRKIIVPGQRAIVVDERLSALRTQPDVKAPLDQRLRRGRIVGILGSGKGKDGQQFSRIAVTRNTRGWILSESIVKSGNAADAERLLKLIESTADEFVKVRLAKLCADEFRAAKTAPRCLMLLGETAEQIAERLTREAKRRVGNEEPGAGLSRRDYLLNFAGLDRYNRIGITFDLSEATDKIVYDGAAYRELLRRHPRSAEASEANSRLERLKEVTAAR
ncbi:MAG TPA: hypothetical protein PLD20_11735 [Blastocatellia bacterium]|nr:hypothetical protein [Blastocatellia bacterium]HMX25179.1 hypothetical protein [Blastocatellia bacterium]HMY72280.1 hypothetical protein [Blastocatellia bacterium]HMZ18595.1 hypothetical protein [Blastocatellia bacterium]HNG29068.1 hypothetical protein [Blastocatellia bacterium]